jgi:hypothetical protein
VPVFGECMISFGLEDSFVLKLVIVVVRVVFASLHVNPDIHGHACLPSEKKTVMHAITGFQAGVDDVPC